MVQDLAIFTMADQGERYYTLVLLMACKTVMYSCSLPEG